MPNHADRTYLLQKLLLRGNLVRGVTSGGGPSGVPVGDEHHPSLVYIPSTKASRLVELSIEASVPIVLQRQALRRPLCPTSLLFF
jgi:hypothetical protein